MKKLFSIILASIAMTSCVETIILPENKTVDEDFWQKKSEVQAVIATAYAQLRDAAAIRNMIVWGDFRSDELVITSSAVLQSQSYFTALQQIYSLNIETENAFTTWYPFYSCINYCNLVLEKAEGVVSVDPDYTSGDYDANRAQVLALRAFCYFYLTKVFHDIPVTPHAYMNSSDDLNIPQSSPAEVINTCISDLEEARKYAISGSTYNDWRDKGYFNRESINALLADIYLWRASVNRSATDYEAAVQCCDNVITAMKEATDLKGKFYHRFEYSPDQKYNLARYDYMYGDIFGADGQNADESIFELQYRLSDINNAGLDMMYYRYGNRSANNFGYLKASKLYGVADQSTTGKAVFKNPKDQRLYESVFDANGSGSEFDVRKMIGLTSLNEPGKSQKRIVRDNLKQNWIIYRLTDVMLMKAEALVQLYNLGGKAADDPRNEEAFEICKFVNNRALPTSELANEMKYVNYQNAMEELVLIERARELCFEGKRWFDLMRYNYRHTTQQADLTKKLTESFVMNSDEFFSLALAKYSSGDAMKAKMRDERYLYMPINQDEMEVNTSLVQNPVYKSATTKK